MSHVYISDFADHVGEEVIVRGWLYNLRSKGKLHFLQIRDGSGFVQGVMGKHDASEEVFAEVATLGKESSVIVHGTVKADARAPSGFELSPVSNVDVQQAVNDYPIAKIGKDQEVAGVDFLLDRRHLWLREPKQHALLRVRNRIIKSIRDFFDERDFMNVDGPIFTPNACEGTSTLFATKYFDEEAYLSQSGQLYMEAAAMAHGRAYCFGPTFRAEKSKTRRHLTEFWMVEPEWAWATLEDVMQLAEDFLCRIVSDVLEHSRADLERLDRDISKLEAIKGPFPRMTYDEVVDRLNDEGQEFKWGDDFGAPDETKIGSWSDTPVMVHRWPKDIKAFYMAPDPEDDRVVLGVDVIAPEGKGEIIGGAQRAHSLDYLLEQIKKHDLSEDAFSWYLDLRRYGACPTAGFGLGLERTVGWISGVEHVRECIPFPRMMTRLTP